MMRQTLQPSLIASGRGRTILIAGGERGVIYSQKYDMATGLSFAVLRKAQQYGVWKEVRRWAKEHPLAVPFVNQDTDMIHSIADTGWTRWIEGTAASYFTTHFKPTSGVPFEITYHSIFQKSSARQLEGWNSSSGWWGISGNGSSFGQNGSGISFNTTDINEVKVKYTSGNNCNLTLNGSGTQRPTMSFVTFNWGNIVGWGAKECVRDKKIDLQIVENGELKHMYYPYKLNGQMELLDIVTGTLATRVGTFTESIEKNQ